MEKTGPRHISQRPILGQKLVQFHVARNRFHHDFRVQNKSFTVRAIRQKRDPASFRADPNFIGEKICHQAKYDGIFLRVPELCERSHILGICSSRGSAKRLHACSGAKARRKRSLKRKNREGGGRKICHGPVFLSGSDRG